MSCERCVSSIGTRRTYVRTGRTVHVDVEEARHCTGVPTVHVHCLREEACLLHPHIVSQELLPPALVTTAPYEYSLPPSLSRSQTSRFLRTSFSARDAQRASTDARSNRGRVGGDAHHRCCDRRCRRRRHKRHCRRRPRRGVRREQSDDRQRGAAAHWHLVLPPRHAAPGVRVASLDDGACVCVGRSGQVAVARKHGSGGGRPGRLLLTPAADAASNRSRRPLLGDATLPLTPTSPPASLPPPPPR
jgi:hypothetical protein